ncbi:MAG TPA: hypothetical protein VKT82_15290 [Ktedonobacterales bacterium]|nr:hypothetical protein [Ktedonobacterales bacterium]
MSTQQPPSGGNQNTINVSGGSFNADNVVQGSGNITYNNKSVYENGKPTIDVDELKKTLLELHKSLEAAALPEDAKIDAQVAASQARKAVDQQDVKTEALVGHIKEAGDALQSAGATIERGSQVAASVLRIASIVGPLVAGGAKVVASWFGLPLF